MGLCLHLSNCIYSSGVTYLLLLTGLFVVIVMVWYCGQPVGHGVERFIQMYAVRIAVRPLDWPLSQSLRRTVFSNL